MIGGLRLEIQEALGLSSSDLDKIIIRAPRAYKIYTIPKKSGGERIIAQPARETKYIQHWLIENVFKELPVHKCATAYKTGASIKLNAAAHQKNSYLTKFDFKDFFGSIKESDLVRHFCSYIQDGFGPSDIADMARVSCIKMKTRNERCLSIGAPSSPILSNSVMYDFDRLVYDWCREREVVYTRYADDLTFSTNVRLISVDIEPFVRTVLSKLDYPRLRLNDKKTTHLSKKFQRRVTGVVLNNNGSLSLGRERKRAISAQIHRFSLGALEESDIYVLQGLLGFANDIEPEFVDRMSAKYGRSVVESVFKIRKP